MKMKMKKGYGLQAGGYRELKARKWKAR